MSSGIGGVLLQFKADTKKAEKNIDRLTKSIKNVSDESKSSGSRLGKLGKVGFAAVAAGAAGAAFALVDFAKAAAEDERQARKLATVLKRIPGVTDAAVESTAAWVDKMELLTTIADTDLRLALQRLAPVTGDLGKAQDLVALAADASVGSGREFATVATAMAKAAGGNVTALRRLFPELDAGPDKVLTLAEAMDQLGASYGGAAKSAADNDPFARLRVVWDQLRESLGQFVLGPLESFSTWFGDPANQAKVQDWINKVGEWSRTVGEEFKGKIEEFLTYLGSPEGQRQMADFAGAVGTIADAISALATALGKLKSVWDGTLDRIFGVLSGMDKFFSDTVPKWGRGLGLNDKPTPYEKRTGKWFDGDPFQFQSQSGRRSGGGTVTINQTINNPRAETASTSTAASLRAARNLLRAV